MLGQAFNTTTSMGRLTLNVLLSFAQFEREVTGERIRDKIAASKARGMWMGGVLPLGYDTPTDLQTRALVINPSEAETVRLIFDQYLTMGSVHALRAWLEERGIRSKSWTSTRGRQMGGATFSRGALFHLLKNRVYLGHIPHKTLSYPGAHPPIIDPETFERVQQGLRDRTRERKGRTTTVRPMILKGLLFDDGGRPMSPCFTRKGPNKLYRYYVSTPLLRGEPLGAHDVTPDRRLVRPIDVEQRSCPASSLGDQIGRHIFITMRHEQVPRGLGEPSTGLYRSSLAGRVHGQTMPHLPLARQPKAGPR